ncbi:glycyl-radical enzyme activating protein [Desulfopila sp. IMCC35006]|uniref:glycyl-radical enzyme activating protein n=1 Tax=Desulfopila sp. IMCC35006 TaxID=2569542 RepID=UPI0010AB84F0|nr:glycyl-radical enzyme activating protein [Desulfopila sp. IMCC35006]TKB26160.1 glycyl-radical enzyme activating protein [Desulfopila sp. IMCC35006]
MDEIKSTIFAIKRYALHDGPNIRTTIFFKGCPLSCNWCHNPEGIDFNISIITLNDRCVGCAECIATCAHKALQRSNTGISRDDRLCTLCQSCVETCPALAHEPTGWQMTTQQLLHEIQKDVPFYDQSGGGVTISGGEPLSQPEGLLALLQGCAALGIHRTVDSSAFAPTATLLRIARYTDLFLIDLKHMNTRLHRQYTGVANDLILHNLQKLAEIGRPARVRIPLIPGVNDDEINIRETGAFVARCKNVQGIDVLPYHPSATAKYKKLGLKYKGMQFTAPTQDTLSTTVDLLKNYLSDVRIGG